MKWPPKAFAGLWEGFKWPEVRGRFQILMVWSIDRPNRSVLHVNTAMVEMDAAGVSLYSDQQAIDRTSPFGKAMMQMPCVFGELENYHY